MSKYSRIRHVLGALFSIDIGLSEEAQISLFKNALHNPEWREALQKELLMAVNDPQTHWMELVSNDDYEVDDAISDSISRKIILSLLWKTTFPNEPIPDP